MSEQLLKEPNKRGNGISKVSRLTADNGCDQVVSKVQQGYYCRPIWNLFRRTPLVRREQRALTGAAKAGVQAPRVLDYRQTAERNELITSFIADALSLDQAINRYPEARIRILQNLGIEIGKLHGARWTHGALYPDHLLVCPQEDFRVYLIDLEKGRRSLRRGRDLARFRRHNPYLTQADLAEFDRSYAAALVSPRPTGI